MRFSWKEILIVACLALLATGLSLFFKSSNCFPCPSDHPFCFPLCTTERGFPIPYWRSVGGNSQAFAVDFLFYFAITSTAWIIIRRPLRKHKI